MYEDLEPSVRQAMIALEDAKEHLTATFLAAFPVGCKLSWWWPDPRGGIRRMTGTVISHDTAWLLQVRRSDGPIVTVRLSDSPRRERGEP